MAQTGDRGPRTAPVARLLVEVWWESRERRWARPVFRGRVTELPDGPARAFKDQRQLAALLVSASRRRRVRGA